MSKWREVRISELGTVNRGKSKHRPRNDKKLYGGKYPFIQTADVKEANLYISNHSETYNEIGLAQSKLWDKDTLCITIAANIGDSAILSYPACFPDSIVGFKEYQDKSNLKFVKYCLDIYKRHLEAISMGATQNNLSIKKLESLRFLVPDLQTQEKIAHILSTYDELIENNNRRIQILEKSAEEIYKEWFVRMRFPGHENTKLEKGIPEGWEVKKISEIIDIADGTHDTPKKVDEGVPLVTGKNITNGTIDFTSTYNISYEDYEKINIRSAIFENDILYSNIGTIGTMTIVGKSNEYSVKNLIIIKSSQYRYYEYLYLLFKDGSSQDYFNTVASGASQKFISLTEMRKYRILLPGINILEKFKLIVEDLFDIVQNLQLQNQNLIKQRDLLLPRLMNGTIEVQ